MGAGRATSLVVLGLVATCSGSDLTSQTTEPVTTETTPSDTAPPGAPTGPVAPPVRHPATERPIYFVMPDRFENGDPSNDTGGVDPGAGPLVHGHEPTDIGFHHGGDLAGLTARLPYIAELGMGAIWITPPFTNRYVQGDGTLEGSSSSYHGYWQIDWSSVDPHLGTDEEMIEFVDAAHELGLHVYFDIVVNHTGDVITYEPLPGETEPSFVYRSTANEPYTPTFADPADATVKWPDWLNDTSNYHNRGNSTFQGESSLFGDFFGLDDLATELPVVVDGMIELYGDVIERYDVDGFRIDTMKHVDVDFWEEFAPAIRERAAELGKPDFFMFGEVFSTDPILTSTYTNAGVPATLDFIVAGGIDRYVAEGGTGEIFAQAFDDDDWFTDADKNASMQVGFYGNHDEGRMGHLLDRADPGADDERLLARARLANDLLFLTRGVPVVYYGDEQGFTGTGGDRLARQSMFPAVAPDYVDDVGIGSDVTPAEDNFDPTHPLYTHIAELAAFREEHPTLVTGAQIVHDVDGPLFAFSRVDRTERVEYVVVTNSNPSLAAPARIDVLSDDADFEVLRGEVTGPIPTDENGEILVEVAPLSTVVVRATSPLPAPSEATHVTIVRPDDGAEVPTPRYRIEAELDDDRFAEVTFAVRDGDRSPVVLGVDDAAPYRIYWDTTPFPDGSTVDLIATVDDGSGSPRSDTVSVTLGDRS